MLNLITDAWIPVRRKDGSRATIAPWQMADESLAFPDWPRPDLNIACLELLIGLVFLADPPTDARDWRTRQAPDPERLRARLSPFAPAFELMGEGPRFCQDREAFEGADANDPDMLFIDSAGGQTVRNNADLMVKRGRYGALDPALAAMALYTLQAHAPSGGKGNRTSMRGGGPMVTLIDPGGGLWPLVWANVPDGVPATPDVLPWMRRTRTSERGEQVFPQDAHPAEAFFGMPRRLRLIGQRGRITGVAQKPYGTNYAGWEHPLTPHYRQKAGAELLPLHPRAGAFGYRNWLGVALPAPNAADTARRAQVAGLWQARGGGRRADLIVAGWAMDNMKPRDFTFSRAPLLDLPDETAERVEGFVEAAVALGGALRGALAPVLAEGESREAAREEFFARTQGAFEARLAELTAAGANPQAVAQGWLADLRAAALAIFDAQALPGLAERDIRDQQAIVKARSGLTAAFAGYGKLGQGAWTVLGLTPPEQKRRKAA
ncbi:CRISPR type I-E/ protein CasA/Cse1 [Rubellimicrobium thermophilum DSM 16684]|uniref:CRISPR type I-E/ protein CasA/Cse1 n=1 Tax=Rubellimicrobium thermophilum DSM 16684 TaxID=1123069 RepID=S9SDP5_9RHOB|nr:type I-E CRISPR-associated protein Cse1/CasA [Rubellimicrobium thermophilum]EPX84369.1 CRISPR type I-E/ protein CasA/Cse1 [Rubellimicrobium thermophilum DSM 16684]